MDITFRLLFFTYSIFLRYLDFAIFLDEDAERDKIQCNEFLKEGYFYPSKEIHLAG